MLEIILISYVVLSYLIIGGAIIYDKGGIKEKGIYDFIIWILSPILVIPLICIALKFRNNDIKLYKSFRKS